MSHTTSTLHVARRFGAALIAASPLRTLETIALTIAVGVFEGVGLLLLVPLLQLIGLDAQQGALGRVQNGLRAVFSMVGLAPTLPLVLGLYVGVIAMQSTLQRWQSLASVQLREEFVHVLRGRVYRAVAGSSWVYFSRKRAAAFLEVLTEKIDHVAGVSYYLIDIVVTATISLAYVAMAFRVSASMTAFVLVCGAVLGLGLRGRLRRAHQAGHEYSAAGSRLYAATSDFLDSMKIAKGYGAEERHAAEFARFSLEFTAVSRSSASAAAGTRQWLGVGSAALLAMLVYVAHGVIGMPPAALFLLMFLFARLVPRLTSLYDRAHALITELPHFETVVAAEEQALAAAEPNASVHRDIVLQRTLELRDVTFSYSETGSPVVLDRLQLSCAARATTAIVGPSGAGKSTVADLMMGLVTPSAGHVLIDDQPLSPELLQSWRRQIGYVPQETLLFHDTVLANLRWANPDATIADVWQALALAAAEDFVKALPHGLETILGDRGVLISGGERQRLSLARAMLRRPRLLILDEATSSLDSENERRIQDAIERLHEQITIVVITHRLSTIRNADLIHVVDGGRVVESGSWSTLMSSGARFRALCEAQGVHGDSLPAEKPTRLAAIR